MKQTVRIERMSYGPCAISHLDNGKTVFVEGAAPDDTVEIEIVEDKPSYCRGTIMSIVSPSAKRVKPKSPIDQACGTAPWQHLAYDAQLQAKRANIVGALIHGAHMDSDEAELLVGNCLPSKHEWGYRNKMELACGLDKDDRFVVGFYREGTDTLVPATSSALAHKAIEKAPKALQGAIRYFQGNQNLGIFRIGVRHSFATGEIEVAIWTLPGPFPRGLCAKTISTSLKPSSIVRVLANPGKARKIKGVETLEGRGFWRERIGDVEFSTQAPAFFQVNTNQAKALVDTVIAGIGNVEGAYVADLYAGGGTFSIPLAQAGADVVAVESFGPSVRGLRHNADMNGTEIEIIGGDAARELRDLGKLDALVVDPPRAGLAAGVAEDIADASPRRVAYVSCNPSTWARDVQRFAACGYRLVNVVPIDMFPQTYHVELASFFEPAK